MSSMNDNKEKLAAAKKRLKQFKKDRQYQLQTQSIENDFIVTNTTVSDRSSPLTINGHVDDYYDNNDENLNEYFNKKYQKDIDMYKDQLAIHLQTIGILVAEKTELQSTLQQHLKKIEKKQEECEELSGRLKQTKQKMHDLENQLLNNHSANANIDAIKSEYEDYIENIKINFNTKLLENDELKIRLSEISDKYQDIKVNQVEKLNKQISDLNNQLEMSNLKLLKFTTQYDEKPTQNTDNDLDEKISELNRLNNELIAEKNNLKSNYIQYVENLVDQINKMTDEREQSFETIKKLESKIIELKSENDRLVDKNNHLELNNLNSDTDQIKQQLECEVQYFKQQIELLLNENNHLNGLLVEKENELNNFKREFEQMGEEKKVHSKLIDEMYNEKLTLSRALQQNNDLKKQINELENEYIKLTNNNAELLNSLQNQEYINKNLSLDYIELETKFNKLIDDNNLHNNAGEHDEHQRVSHKNNIQIHEQVNLGEVNINDDWNNEIDENNVNIKVTIEKENETDVKPNKIFDLLNLRIKNLESERNELFAKLNELKVNQSQSNNANFGLLEQKFFKVMKENADLKEKNQQLEHLIEQLQCETDTIIDYISLYQIEREKLAQKYRIKDDYIEKLNQKLELNRFNLNEFNRFLNELFYSTDETNIGASNKTGLLLQELNCLLKNLSDLNEDLILNTDEKKLKYDQLASNLNISSNENIKLLDSVILCSSCQGDYFVV